MPPADHLLPPPLVGIRVLDLSRVLAGPYCTMMLGDLGADVIKVESPEGDDTRNWGPPYFGSESAYYLSCNRNKRGIVVDLGTEQGREIVRSLADRSDVLVENFRAGTMERWGLGCEEIRRSNPGLIYCSISGYGRTGPDADLPGYDYVIQAAGGMMSITGEPDGAPMKVGVAIVDLTAGMFALSAVLAALRLRDLTGQGQHIDMSLFDSQLAWLGNVGSNYLVTGENPRRYGNAHPNIVPYQAFQTSDGWMVVAVGNDRQWGRFCTAIGRPDLAGDPLYSTNALRIEHRDLLVPILEELFRELPSARWLTLLRENDIPSGPVNTVAEALSSEQARARGMVEEVQHPLGPLLMVGSPLKLDDTAPAVRRHPPLHGEHTGEVLGELLGYTVAEISALRDAGVIR
ncbi:MAG TPA: CoA transferase [Chloroflexia bacterium]|nr:CoA transferase [Chloroflexia bacterium]